MAKQGRPTPNANDAPSGAENEIAVMSVFTLPTVQNDTSTEGRTLHFDPATGTIVVAGSTVADIAASGAVGVRLRS